MFLNLLVFVIPALSLVIYPDAEVFAAPADVQDGGFTSSAIPIENPVSFSSDDPLPVIIWHGLGDSADNQGIKDVAKLIEEVNPGTYTYVISVTEDVGGDRHASFFGNVTEQLDYVCHKLAEDRILSAAPAVDALGFSQGGQFLRGYVERCGGWAPRVRTLMTFGSQHNGIAEFQKCKSATDFLCHAANAVLKSSTVWSDYVQSHLVPAQYYRNVEDFDMYIQHSNYLADINNEREEKNKTYAKNLAKLERFVMLLFKDDDVVIPKESAWFTERNATSGNVTHLKDRPIYKEDWIGLKQLDKKNALVFEKVEGGHMQLSEDDLTKYFKMYFGSARKKFDDGSGEHDLKFEL